MVSHCLGKAAYQEKQILHALLENFGGAQTILDVGCGTGYFTDWFRGLGYPLAGLDKSLKMLHQGQMVYDLDCCLGDATRLPFSSDSFDIVSLITVLEFLADPIAALREGVRVTRHGFILGVINRYSLLGIHYRHEGGPIWGSANLLTPSKLIQLLFETMDRPGKISYKTTLWVLFSEFIQLTW